MPHMMVSTGRTLISQGTYADKVLSYGPIAYWPMNEKGGTTAYCLINPAQNGTYGRNLALMGTAEGIGDGNTAPSFDGANDYLNCSTVSLNTSFNGSEGTIGVWWRADALSFNDGTLRRIYIGFPAGTDFVILSKLGTNSNLSYQYSAGGVAESHTLVIGAARTTWTFSAMTWSATADLVAYYDGPTRISTDNTLGAWGAATMPLLVGAGTIVPVNVFYGSLAHVFLLNYAATPAQIADLATV